MYLNFEKNELLPVIIQHAQTGKVLMLAYMNQEALDKTLDEGIVTFFSRSRQQLWTKGETSGNFLKVVSLHPDCDQDSLLIQVLPTGPVCHTGTESCFGIESTKGFLYNLESIIRDRIIHQNDESYTARMFRKGINAIAQKVGEEAVEVVIAAKDDNKSLFEEEAADLIFHLLLLCVIRGSSLESVENVLQKRSVAPRKDSANSSPDQS